MKMKRYSLEGLRRHISAIHTYLSKTFEIL